MIRLRPWFLLVVSVLPHLSISVPPSPKSGPHHHANHNNLNAGVPPEPLKYPELRRDESVMDDYYGMKVHDPYRYLEDPDSEETKKFVEAQNKLTEEYLGGQNTVKQDIEKKITEIYNYPKYGVPRRYGNRYYTSMNTGLQNQDVIYYQDTLDDEAMKVFFDPNALSADGTVHLSELEFSDDGELVVLGLNSKGSDWMTVRIRNVSSGEEYPETLNDIKFSNIAWTDDNLGFFYARYPKLEGRSSGTETVKYGNQKIYYHRVGTNQSEDVLVVEFEDAQLLIGYFVVTEDGKNFLIFPSKGSGENMVYFASLEAPLRKGGITGKLDVIPIVPKLKNEYSYITSQGSVVYLQTNEGAPNYRIIGVDLNKPEQASWTTLVPEHNKNILNWAYNVDNDKLVLKYLVDVKSQLEIRSLADGKLIQQIQTPLGSVDGFAGKRKDNEFFFRVVSFLTPSIIYRVDLSKSEGPYEAKVIREVKVPGFDASKFITKQVFYPSKDGTLVPMFVIHKKDLPMNANASTIIYGYGGFNINILPSFRSERIVFLNNFDGVYAIPNIRGGGEYGQRWHEGGRLLNKQNVFDDFQAAAEFLIRERYTNAKKIAINGGSNGGLLVAACVNQRPDLYGAGIAQVGVHDLLRFQKFTIGYAWCSEYGCSDNGNKTIFDNLYRLSPLHNVRLPVDPNVQYPAVLLTTGDHDDRVVPLHSYKLISELQYKIGRDPRQTNPLLIKIQTSAGHGAGKPTSKKIEEFAEVYSFLVKSAGFVFTP